MRDPEDKFLHLCLKENKSDTSSLIELIKIRIKYLEM